MMRLHFLIIIALFILSALPVQAAPREISLDQDTLGTVSVLAPVGEPNRFIIFVFDGELTSERRANAEAMVAQGAAVAPISSAIVLQRLDQETDADATCVYALGEFEDLSTLAQHALGTKNYHWPIILGAGPISGTVAYLALAQAPPNTAAGAVSIGMRTKLASRLPFCAGANASPSPDGGFIYAPSNNVPGRWVLIMSNPPGPEIDDIVKASNSNELRVVPGDEHSQFQAVVAACIEVGASSRASVSGLPLVELPSKERPVAVAIFISGDGGWRDIDKQVAEVLAGKNIAVVGIDAMRYFWRKKTPEVIAGDLERIALVYGERWQVQTFALLGYSMGADVLPPAWPFLPETMRNKVKLVALIGLEPTAAFEISLAGYLGVPSAAEIDIESSLRTLPVRRVMCFYGADEEPGVDTACTLPELDGATRIMRPGGHHFDGEYQPIAQAVLDQLQTQN
jgi:type IV secretory pathway VirJ component